MRKHRKLLIGVVALIIVAIAAFVLYHRMAQAPDAVLLLPDGDLLLYVNLKPIHFLNLSKSTQGDSEYKEFVRQTGIDWGRDLDNVAISQRNPGPDSESSAIFTGHFGSGSCCWGMGNFRGLLSDNDLLVDQGDGHQAVSEALPPRRFDVPLWSMAMDMVNT